MIGRQISNELSGVGYPFLAFGIALNLAVGQISLALKIPMYLDSIGTVLVAVVCGPWSAIVAGVFSNLIASAFGNPALMFFIPVMVVIGAFTGFLAKAGWFRKWYLVVVGGILQGIIAALASAPISAYLFSGVMLAGTDFLVMYFRSMGNSLLESVFYQGLASDPVDKTVTYIIVFLIVKNFPKSLLHRFRGAQNLTQSTNPL